MPTGLESSRGRLDTNIIALLRISGSVNDRINFSTRGGRRGKRGERRGEERERY